MTTNGGDVWIPRLSLGVAILTILSSTYLQRTGANDQLRLKRFEVTFLEKRNAYVEVVRHLSLVLGAMEDINESAFLRQLALTPNPAITPPPRTRTPPPTPTEEGIPEQVKPKWERWKSEEGELGLAVVKLKPFLDDAGRVWLDDQIRRLSKEWITHYAHDPPMYYWYEKQQHQVSKFADALFARLFPAGEPDSPK